MLARIVGLPEKQTRVGSEEWRSFIFPQDAPLLTQGLQTAIQTDKPINVDYRLLDRHGNILWVSSRAVVSKDTTGKPIRAGGVIVDITRHQNAEDLLRASEERYRLLADISPDGILVNVETQYVYVNQAAARMLGADSANGIVGHSLYDFVDEDQRDLLLEHVNPFLKKTKMSLDPLT